MNESKIYNIISGNSASPFVITTLSKATTNNMLKIGLSLKLAFDGRGKLSNLIVER